ncbi:hypothetical protein P3T18_000578 [Paraburkholderia sp. GAS199]
MPPGRWRSPRRGRMSAPCPIASGPRSLLFHCRIRIGKPTGRHRRNAPLLAGRKVRRFSRLVSPVVIAICDAVRGSHNPSLRRFRHSRERRSAGRRTGIASATSRRPSTGAQRDRQRRGRPHRASAGTAIGAAEGGGYVSSRHVDGVRSLYFKRLRRGLVGGAFGGQAAGKDDTLSIAPRRLAAAAAARIVQRNQPDRSARACRSRQSNANRQRNLTH